jgi:hypothetical protein
MKNLTYVMFLFAASLTSLTWKWSFVNQTKVHNFPLVLVWPTFKAINIDSFWHSSFPPNGLEYKVIPVFLG